MCTGIDAPAALTRCNRLPTVVTGVTKSCVEYHSILSGQVIGLYVYDECSLSKCVHHDAAKYRCDHLDSVSKTWIHQKRRCLAIRALSFIVYVIFEESPVCDAASRVTRAMVSKSPCYCIRLRTVAEDTYYLLKEPNL
ncbi:hypothetical protein TNCV_4944921 [Trichonephila clavipes]|nr:hypothetical protein TNCV_4944921 [Trichonephila clavipes]